ncbi:4Fe-4S cluster-binding domain-containing protein [Helicobacter rodentium]|uniref:4Fe-4S cluster-binding domain-containing protein n=1 Tax=Helicobacter rodentium TaxID=59617 RepID=UPI002357C4CB|nr:4Fe-4S cluster-binding domain-containing protein [Helicobacter rodentium]
MSKTNKKRGGGQNKLKSFIQNKKLWILSLLKNAKQHQKIKARLEILENQNIHLTIQNQHLEKSIQTLKEQNKILSNQNVATIHSLHKLTPQAYLKLIEIHLAEHCNLNCFSCAHFSQLSPKHFPSLEQFSKDMQQLNSITKGLIGRFHLMGGEPLLNPNCKDFFAVTRKFFPDSAIWLVTNGILLETQPQEFWESCKENNIEIHPTKYPIKIDWNLIEAQCKTYGIPLIFFNNAKIEKTSLKFVLEPKGNCNPLESFTKCGMANNCTQLKEGKLYPCNIAANIEIFNSAFNQNLPLNTLDSIDIYKAKDYSEILQFLAKPIPFCRFCNLSKWQNIGEWKTSKKEITEYLE